MTEYENIEVTNNLQLERATPLSVTNQGAIDAIWRWVVSRLTSNASSGQKIVNVIDGSLFEEDQDVLLRDDNNNEKAEIDTINGNQLTMKENLEHTYYASANAKVEKFNPAGFTTGDSHVFRLKCDSPENHVDTFLITLTEDNNAPLKTIDQGMIIKKDLSVGGFVSSGQGILYLGSGFTQTNDPPEIRLLNGGSQLTANVSQGTDTIPVVSTYGMNIGNVITLKDDNNSETLVIESLTPTQITTTTNLVNNYTTGANAVVKNFDTLHLTQLNGLYAHLKCASIEVDEVVDNIIFAQEYVQNLKDIHIDKTAPTLNLTVSNVMKAAFGFDGTDAHIMTNTGKLILTPYSYVQSSTDIHIAKTDPRLILADQGDNVKATLRFDGTNTILATEAGALVFNANSQVIRPIDDNQHDLGSESFRFKNGYFAGTIVGNANASLITTGTFNTARIPNLDASKITSGTFSLNRIPNNIPPEKTTFTDQYLNQANDALFNSVLCANGCKAGGGSPYFASLVWTGGKGYVTSHSGDLNIESATNVVLNPTNYVKSLKDIHIDTAAGTPTLNFDVSGVQKGALGYASGNIYLRADVGSIKLYSASNAILPYNSNQTLGNSGNYWANFYSALATIGNCTITSQAKFTNFQDQIKFEISGQQTYYHMCKPMDDKCWAVYNVPYTTWKAYLTQNNGDMYVIGSYYTYSPHVPSKAEDIAQVIRNEVEKPYAERDEDNVILCPVCHERWGNCKNPEHRQVLEKDHGKDIGLISLASGKLVSMLYDEINALQSRLEKLENQKEVA